MAFFQMIGRKKTTSLIGEIRTRAALKERLKLERQSAIEQERRRFNRPTGIFNIVAAGFTGPPPRRAAKIKRRNLKGKPQRVTGKKQGRKTQDEFMGGGFF